MDLLKEHVKKVEESFKNIENVELDMTFKESDVKIDIQQAKVIGSMRQCSYDEKVISPFDVLPNDNDVEISKRFSATLRQEKGVAEIVTTFKQLTLNGALTAQYNSLGAQLGICHTQGKSKTNIRSSKTEVEEKFEQDVKVPAKTKYRACVIRELLSYECDLENVRLVLSTKKPFEIVCKVILSNGKTEKKKYKIQDVLKDCRDDSSDGYVYKLKGKYRWILLQRRIKTVPIP